MIGCGSLEFAHARLHARCGQRADESTWQRLETVRELAVLLETARGTSLQPWVLGITATASARQIEVAMLRQWRKTVAEVVGWTPARWQAALVWCTVLPDLPLLQHLACGGEVSAAMLDDPELRRSKPGAQQQVHRQCALPHQPGCGSASGLSAFIGEDAFPLRWSKDPN